jgi:catechol 2,3-dioxygenase-like lactoylglutathione lyase family enzyme
LFFTNADRIDEHHYVFLVSDDEFDAAVGRLKVAGTTIYAKSDRTMPRQVIERWGGRGLYFNDLDGHLIELLTRSPSPKPSSANHPDQNPQRPRQ